MNAFFALAFTSKTCFQKPWSQAPGENLEHEVQSPAPGDEQAMHQYMLVAT